MDNPRPCCRARAATTRPAHLCRGRGDRACRCHLSARPRHARPAPRPAPRVADAWARRDQPDRAPARPQAPPPAMMQHPLCIISGYGHDHRHHP
ncbi:MAG: hypothetical protein MEQ74_04390 [Paracoccus sp.]|nr:hypothetical protein [Paracoccus sp. (in: a-proteobacteria)]